MKLSDFCIDFIVKQGVTYIFEFIGGAITHLLDSTYDRKDVQCVSVHHEQAGAFAAEAYARINGKLGVAMATSGPGALNMVTGIGSCYFDSVPCLFITGQVNTYEYKFDRTVRQIGFQETDIVSVVKPLVKYAEMVTDPQKIRYQLEKAVYLARSGRPGPVLLDIPMNIQRAQIEIEALESFYNSAEYIQTYHKLKPDDCVIDEVIRLMEKASRPLILAGGGVRLAGATQELLSVIEKTKIPMVTSLMGLDVIPHDHAAFVGMIGAYGHRYSNLTLANCDFLLILGSRLDTRQTGTRPDTFARAAKKVHVDIDVHELNAKVAVDLAIHADVKNFLHVLNNKLTNSSDAHLSSWYQVIENYREKYVDHNISNELVRIDPNSLMTLLSTCCEEGDIICLDVGQNQMWAAQSFRLKKYQRMLISGGMGAMGFALPAAIGAVLADKGRKAIVIVGDGGMQVNIQELDLIAKRNLPIKIFVMNNGCLGMVRQFQDLYFNGRQQSTVLGYSCSDFVQVARAYGISAAVITFLGDAAGIIDKALKTEGPMLINVLLNKSTVVNPKLVVNRPIEDMSPHLDKEELQSIMMIDLVD